MSHFNATRPTTKTSLTRGRRGDHTLYVHISLSIPEILQSYFEMEEYLIASMTCTGTSSPHLQYRTTVQI
jgi:hypothetical protein